MANEPKVTMIYDDGEGNVSTVALAGDLVQRRDGVLDWFLHTGLPGLGFTDAVPFRE